MSARIDRARLSLLRSGKGSSYIDKEPGFKYMIEYCGKIAGRLEDIKNKYGK